jgi:threonine synthase
MAGKVQYYSTNRQTDKVNFSKALLKGLAPDNGLYMPDQIPVINDDQLISFCGMSYHEIAYIIARKFLINEIPDDILISLVKESYNFDIPIEKVFKRKYIMRLDQGPTASFKDFAARLMGRLMQYFLMKEGRNVLILAATSGDTGSAIANAFYGLGNIQVVILFPENEVTPRQRKQMTTLRKNIKIIALKGKFDDCQALVKQAFIDKDLEYLGLSSANSINIGRLLPQSFYYFYAWSKLAMAVSDQIIFAVPSGNFGNLMGGLIAKKMGLPVKKFIVATNENDEVPVYWQTGSYRTIVPSRNCISSAMNVGHPSNMARVIALYGGIMDEKGNITKEPDFLRMHDEIYAISISDKQTINTLLEIYNRFGILTEPHGAAGWAGMQAYLRSYSMDNNPEQLIVSIETAHPAKFPEEVRRVLGIEPDLPSSMKGLDSLKESYDTLENDYTLFRDYLRSHY